MSVRLIHLVTCCELPEPDPDESLLLSAVTREGVHAQVVAWDDPAVDWNAADVCVVRSTWNYVHRRDAFLAWAEQVARVTRLFNPIRVIAENSVKTYLRSLHRAGIAIAETEWLARGSSHDLAAIVETHGWSSVVIKPTISAASFATIRVDRNDLARGIAHLREHLPSRDMMVQQYVTSVDDHGERSLVWIDGELTHAVRKSPRFLGQSEQVSEAVAIGEDERRFAQQVLSHARADDLLYARVDVARGPIRSGTSQLLLMELELIEPSLFLTHSETALRRLADAIVRRANDR